MASVPLHCNICPKQPTFSDVSHLLTHIGSKGHLSHYFKAQVRARQNPSVREQLDAYERWYGEHQIERLLSQRMILKDSKKPNGTIRPGNREKSSSTKPSKASKTATPNPNPVKPQQLPLTAAPHNVIDPQLSQLSAVPAQQAATQEASSTLSSPGLDLATVYQPPVPRMRTFHAPSSKSAIMPQRSQPTLTTSMAPLTTGWSKDASDTESDREGFSRQRSVKPMYPEPPSTEPLPPVSQYGRLSTELPPVGRGRTRRLQSSKEEDVETEEEFIPKTPELKGICYPGMSLFDSASPDAQRKRNQRKSESLVTQIERDSLEVECNEYIYWPDGGLKMCRYITGDVQSSPAKEVTPPPPPPPKRRRGKKPKDADGATAKKKLRKGTASHMLDREQQGLVKSEVLQTFSNEGREASLELTSTIPAGLDPAGIRPSAEMEGNEWLLNMGEPARIHRRPTPVSLDGEAVLPDRFIEQVRLASGQANPLSANYATSNERAGRGYAPQARAHSEATFESLARAITGQRTEASIRYDSPSMQPPYLTTEIGKENIPPDSDYAGHKTNHRYFMVRGEDAPQISTTLPAEMAFGGMATPPVYRMSLNPLNPKAHLRQSLPYSSNYTSRHAPQLPVPQQKRHRATFMDDTNQDFDPEAFMY
ncbi:MAG: hypothetical protein LQ348_002312 [Seirophora lacunosa]|nr:MAG: hypothetical protein LQ348_002312 [Seirophora lacunosa]